jgi:dienelactone hydrolase
MADTPSRRDFLAALAAAGVLAPDALAADAPRELPPTGADLGSLFADVEKLIASQRYTLSFSEGRFKNIEEFRAAVRPKLLDLLLYKPDKVDPKAEVVERVERDDHVREKIVFSTGPHFRVPAYVLIPKKRSGKLPAIVDLHSHGGMFLFGKEKVIDLGNNHPTMTAYHQQNYDGQPTATALVQRGYIVISIDAFMFGERRAMLDPDLKLGWDRGQYSQDDVKHLNQQCRGKETTLAKTMAFAGLTWPGIVFWDDMRTIDYLVTRDEVDPKRIGCLGISMGGYRTTYLAALDERIKSACIVGFMSSVRPMIKAHVDTHSWVHFLPGLHRLLDLPDVASLTAPRALMVQQCSQDRLFPPEGMKESVAKIAAVYEKAGLKDRFAGRFYDAPHVFTKAMQDEAFDWLDVHLGNKN